MFDRNKILAHVNRLIMESQVTRTRKREEIIKRTGLTGKMIAGDVEPETDAQRNALKAIKSLESPAHKRYVTHLKARKDTPEIKRGIEKRQEAARERGRTSHSTQLRKRIDQISDEILARIGSKDPERREEKKMMKGHRANLEARLKKVKQREESGAPSKREVRKRKKGGPDLH